MKTSIEIAQNADLKPIREVMADLEIAEESVEFYGTHTAKLKLDLLDELADRPDGKLILVTAMTPTPTGEGKTLTTVGLGQALGKLGKRGMIALREPSLGPVFGIKGGAAGGGYAQVLPMDRINLHFNGDIHAIGAAHNLLAAMVDAHIHHGNELEIDVRQPVWGRAMDMNDRSLRQIVGGLGGRVNGVPRESGFVITAASEIMAILALASSRSDLKKRLGEIIIGYRRDFSAVRAADLKAPGAMTVILNEAILPNLVQTMEHTPALIHAGPFANIAHGTSSVIAARIARKMADYVVTEAGFGADLGAEKFFDLVNRSADLWPSAVVVVATCKAIKYHGGVDLADINEENMEAFEVGLGNLEKHVRNLQQFGSPVVVAINRFPFDTPNELAAIEARCDTLGVPSIPHEAFVRGGEGAVELATKVVELADSNPHPTPQYLYDLDQPVEDKIRAVATKIYGADGVSLSPQAQKKLAQFEALGYGELPICIAKTQSSLSDDSRARGVPTGFTLNVSDIALSAGAGFLVVICGNMMLMPGLGKVPAAVHMDVDDGGTITGLF